MRSFALVLAACLITADAAPRSIIGNTLATIDQHPYAAALLYSISGTGTFTQSCSGTIINNRSILSAAHCFFGNSAAQWRVRVGSSFSNVGGTLTSTDILINHPSYNSHTADNDISILRIMGFLSFGPTVAASSIAGTNYNPGDGEAVWSVGWEVTSVSEVSSEQLHHMQVWTIDQDTCRLRYGTFAISDNMLCSGWLDGGETELCQNDSGGPLLHNSVVVGVRSWSYGCADPYYPGVYARVSRYTLWITSNA